MVCAALLRTLLRRDCCLCSAKYKIVTLNPFYDPADKEKRQDRRREELNIWLTSTADDLDLIADWWFFWDTYNKSNVESLSSDGLLLALFIFSCLGSVTWLLEFISISFVRDANQWTWLPILILLFEDIPQVVLTILLQADFDNISNLGIFNIMTSLYSLSIRLASEMFLNCCYGCELVEPDETSAGDDGGVDVEKVAYYSGK